MESYCLNIRALKRMKKSASDIKEALSWMQHAIYCSTLTIEHFRETIKNIHLDMKKQ